VPAAPHIGMGAVGHGAIERVAILRMAAIAQRGVKSGSAVKINNL
jgi:hypothetical protein